MNPLINVTDLSIQSGKEMLVQPISMALHQDQPVTILGQTGSGKSLLVQAIMGLLPESLMAEGQIEIFGQNITESSLKTLWGTKMIMLPQEPWRALDPLMPAYRQVSEVFEGVLGQDPETAFNRTIDSLDQVGLKDHAVKRVGQLSGGMAQRLAVTAATAGGAQLILADEPTKGLDVSRRNALIELLQQSAKGGGLLTITHDIEVARQLGGQIIVMKQGVVVEQGTAEQVLANPTHPYTKALIESDPLHWARYEQGSVSDNPILQVSNLAIGRDGQPLAQGINFTLNAGEIMGVVGDSGCGKSTLGDTLLGLLAPLAGQIDKLAAGSRPYQWLKLFQDPPSALTSSVTLGTLLEDLVRLHQLDRRKISPLMEKLKLSPDLLTRKSTEVSGGELQRFSIMRALLLEPVFLFADEPTSRLDPIIAKEVIDLLVELAKEQQCALLLVSHDPNLIAKRCDSVIHLGQ